MIRMDQGILKQLRQDQQIVEKYGDKSGIYSISIDDKLVYIGKSKNMIVRISNHIKHIMYPSHRDEGYSHKYNVLRQAQAQGHKIKFDVIEYVPIGLLTQTEGKYIRRKKPPLNQQIPKEKGGFVIQQKARWITLKEIMER